jgi:hypothetical protein
MMTSLSNVRHEMHTFDLHASASPAPRHAQMSGAPSAALALLCVVVGLPLEYAHAKDGPATTVEFPAWQRSYIGSLEGKPVRLILNRIDREIYGSYCIQPCTDGLRDKGHVSGTIRGNNLMIAQISPGAPATRQAVMRFRGRLMPSRLLGTVAASNGHAKTSLDLRDERPLPFETRLVAVRHKEGDGACETPPHIVAIKLYRGRRLVQRLATDSQGTCGAFLPTAVDANFDGVPDLTIALSLPASPNIPYQTWLFDPAAQRYRLGPAALQAISSPEFDYVNKVVWSFWRNGCCSHGVTAYRWQKARLLVTQHMQSYALPVVDDAGIRRYCYASPTYHDGRVLFDERVEEVNGKLKLSVSDLDACELRYRFAPETRLDVWRRDNRRILRVSRTERVRWMPVQDGTGTRYCPEVPFFDHGRIVRVLLDNDENVQCSENKP